MTHTATATTYATIDGARLERGVRHTLTGTDGTTFSGISRGVSVSRGVLFAVFEDVEGDVPTTGSRRRWYSLPVANLTTPRPVVFGH